MSERNQKTIEWQDLGLIKYLEGWKLQDELRRQRIEGDISNRLLLLEHPPVFTMGRRDCSEDILSSSSAILADGIEIIKCNRGGRITYHAPGQLVGYFICSLTSLGMGIKEFVKRIEEIVIRTSLELGIKTCRNEKYPGVWIDGDKVAAIGLHVSHDVTEHGFALNFNCDLAPYEHIVACGIRDGGSTRLIDHAQLNLDVDALKKIIIRKTGDVLNANMLKIV